MWAQMAMLDGKRKSYSMLMAKRATSAPTAVKRKTALYQSMKPLPRRMARAPSSIIDCLDDRLGFQKPTEYRVTEMIPIMAEALKKRTGKTEPPIGLSFEPRGATLSIGPKR